MGQMDWREHIAVDPQIMHGTTCIAGTRIPVSVVLDTTDELVAEYPTLAQESIGAALAYAAELTRAGNRPAVRRQLHAPA